MFEFLQLIGWRDDSDTALRAARRQRLAAASAALPMIERTLLAPTVPEACRNGGDLLWHLRFEDEAAYRACLEHPLWQRDVRALLESDQVSNIDGGACEVRRRGVRAPGIHNGIYRALLIPVEEGTAAAQIARFEAEMATMADYIGVIRNWGMNALASSTGRRRFTHLWEQEFDDVAAFRGEYLHHPSHAAYIDLWYDVESPRRIVDYSYPCSSVCPLESSFLAD
jgi:Stress responsive A/B Barrel Domain